MSLAMQMTAVEVTEAEVPEVVKMAMVEDAEVVVAAAAVQEGWTIHMLEDQS